MSVFWLPIGLLLASIGPPAIFIAKRRGRITDQTYRLTWVVWSIAVVLLGIGIGWSSYQMHRPIRDLENLKVRADALQKHIKAAEAQKQLMHFADPLQEADPIALEKYREVLRNTALSISDESKALAQELASVRSQFDELNQARCTGNSSLSFVCSCSPRRSSWVPFTATPFADGASRSSPHRCGRRVSIQCCLSTPGICVRRHF